MRLIDADALKPKIDKFIGYLDEDMIYRIKVVINNAPTIEERPTGEWIPVSERKPDYTGLYLVSLDAFVTSMNFDGVMFTNRSGIRIEVDAWQPLPEPYKKGAEE